jgi:hypothetical protein
MTIRLVRDGAIVRAVGRPTVSNVGLFFGILIMILGIPTLLMPIVGAVVYGVAFIILLCSNRHTKSAQRKALARAGYNQFI